MRKLIITRKCWKNFQSKSTPLLIILILIIVAVTLWGYRSKTQTLLSVQTFLVTTIVVLSYPGLVSYRRNAIRDSIQQVEQMELNKKKKLVPTLEQFNYRFGLRPRTKISIEEYDIGIHSGTASLPGQIYFRNYPNGQRKIVEKYIEGLDFVTAASMGDGFQITVATSNEAEINHITSTGMRAVWFSINKDPEDAYELAKLVGRS